MTEQEKAEVIDRARRHVSGAADWRYKRRPWKYGGGDTHRTKTLRWCMRDEDWGLAVMIARLE